VFLRLERLEERYTPGLIALANFPAGGIAGPSGVIEDSNGDLFGTTMTGGANNDGTVFEVAADSGTITTLASFDGTDGANPAGGVIEDSNGNLFGTCSRDGPPNGFGTVFEVAAGSGTITTLGSFNIVTNGVDPSGVIEDGRGNLFGTTSSGGTDDEGTVFEVAAGSGTVTTLATFTGPAHAGNSVIPSGVIEDGNGNLFGTTQLNGSSGNGTVFEVAAGSGTITTLATFNGSDGAAPDGGVIEGSNGNLLGTTTRGGPNGDGTVFELPANSGTITDLASFDSTNGSIPNGAVFEDSSGNLFGTTLLGGVNGDGTLFELAAGSGTITTLASFDGATNGANSNHGVIQDSSGNCFGTDQTGGANNNGVVFEYTTKDNTSTLLSSSANAVAFGQPVTFTATVTDNSPGAPAPTGTVQFKIDGVIYGNPVSLVNGVATSSSISTLAAGAHTVMAVYSGNTADNLSSGSLTETVQGGAQSSTTTTLASSVNPSVYGQAVTITATVTAVAPGAATPTGTVAFQLDGQVIPVPIALVNGVATLNLSNVATPEAGKHSITASYSGDINNLSSNASQTQTVNADNTTTQISASTNPSVLGQQVTFTATVTPSAPGAGIPTGTVMFESDGVVLGPPVALVNGMGTASFSTLVVGGHTITAVYSSDPNFNASSSSLTQTVQTAGANNTTTVLASSATPSRFGQAVTFAATVTASTSGAATPTGTVQFQSDGADLGSPVALVNGVATMSISTLTVGGHAITALYSGDASDNPSSGALTQTVNADNTSTSLTSSANSSVFAQALTLTATVMASTPGGGPPTGTVQFQSDGADLGDPVALINGVATMSISTLAVGGNAITALYSGDTNDNPSSGSLTQTVSADSTTTLITSSAASSTFGQVVLFTATVAANAPGAGTPTGTVQFQSDGVDLGNPVALVAGVALTRTTTLPVGGHTITALYSGDANDIASSDSVTQTISVDTATQLTSSASSSVFAQTVTFTATVSTNAQGAGTPTGTVQFQIDGVNFGNPVTLAQGVALTSTSTLTRGGHTVTALYNGDTGYNPSSIFLTQTVGPDDTTTLLASSATSSIFDQAVVFTATVSANAPGTGTPTGTVQFQRDGVNLGNPVALVNGVATASAATLAAGDHTITALYGGDANNNPSRSSLTQSVSAAKTTMLISANVNPAPLGAPVTFTATVMHAGPGTGAPTGMVQFQSDGVNLGSPVGLIGGVATTSSATLAIGQHTVTALYSGDPNEEPSSAAMTQIISADNTTILLASSANVSLFNQAVTFTATVTAGVSGAGAPTGTVQFQSDGLNLGSPVPLVNGAATTSTSTLTVGGHTIKALYSGDAANSPSNNSLSQPVSAYSTATRIAASIIPSVFGQPVTFTATVATTSTGSGGTPTGTVQFQSDGIDVGSPVSLVGGVATISTSTLAVGGHTIIALYSGDTNDYASGGSLMQTVNADNITTLLASSSSFSVLNQAVTFTATVVINAPGAGTPIGAVQFQSDGVDLGNPVALVNGVATTSTSTLAVGGHTITALYRGDPNDNPSNGSLTQTVSITPSNPLSNSTSSGMTSSSPTVPAMPTPTKAIAHYVLRDGQTLRATIGHALLRDFTTPKGEHLSIRLAAKPAVGKLTLKPNGSFTFTPPPGFHGKASFKVVAFNGTGVSKPLTVTLLVR
jgi:uncharacterized repeat protein (TIGR03803 family)